MTEFYETRLGHRFYDSTAPRIADELKRLNDLLERIIGIIESGPIERTERVDENDKD